LPRNYSSVETNVDDITEYITISQVAKALGYASTSYLVRQCKAGRITGATQEGKLWYVPRSWVMEEKAKTPTGQGARGKSRK